MPAGDVHLKHTVSVWFMMEGRWVLGGWQSMEGVVLIMSRHVVCLSMLYPASCRPSRAAIISGGDAGGNKEQY